MWLSGKNGLRKLWLTSEVGRFNDSATIVSYVRVLERGGEGETSSWHAKKDSRVHYLKEESRGIRQALGLALVPEVRGKRFSLGLGLARRFASNTSSLNPWG